MALVRTAGWLGLMLLIGLSVLAESMPSAFACGAYFAKRAPTTAGTASSQLYNHSTKMIVARTGNTSTITMTADYRGDPQEFAVVIAVPMVLTREQIKIADRTLIDVLDRFSAPKLVESYDSNPCRSTMALTRGAMKPGAAFVGAPAGRPSLGVTVEAQYVVGEYDVAILSATQSDGLQTWLNEAGYNVPAAAEPVLARYIAEGMKFFVAKVNLQQQQRLGYAMLRPLQINYQSSKFMVPLRLSTINAEGPQEMFVFLLTSRGRVESANYPTYTIPTDVEVPPFVKSDFAGFYRAVFDKLVASSKGRGVFIEHVSVIGPGVRFLGNDKLAELGNDKLTELGATWIGGGTEQRVMLTRLHVRYDAAHFPMDLMLKETSNTVPVIGNFRITHPYAGDATCPEAARYRAQVKARSNREMANVRRVTGWPRKLIAEKVAAAR